MTDARFSSMTLLAINAVGMIALCALIVPAQQERSRTPAPRTNTVDTRARDRDIRDRSMAMDRIGKDQKPQPELLEKVKADFRRLQTTNNYLMRDVMSALNLDYPHIAEAVEEMNQCAKRLKANITVLASPDADKDIKSSEARDDGELKRVLTQLDKAVLSFANSMTEVEAKETGKAAAELNRVIQLTENVKKSVKKLGKNTDKNQR